MNLLNVSRTIWDQFTTRELFDGIGSWTVNRRGLPSNLFSRFLELEAVTHLLLTDMWTEQGSDIRVKHSMSDIILSWSSFQFWLPPSSFHLKRFFLYAYAHRLETRDHSFGIMRVPTVSVLENIAKRIHFYQITSVISPFRSSVVTLYFISALFSFMTLRFSESPILTSISDVFLCNDWLVAGQVIFVRSWR